MAGRMHHALQPAHGPTSGVIAGLVLLACMMPVTAGAQTLRCDRGLVEPGDTRQRVRQACGAPMMNFTERRPVRTVNRNGAVITTMTNREAWAYDMGYGRFMRLLVFDGDRLVSIETGPRRE